MSDATPKPPVWDGAPGADEEERTTGVVSYLAVLERLHQALRPAHYLEIGVRHGASLSLAVGPATGVDPAPAINRPLPPTARVVALTSDEFFGAPRREQPPDFCFIDGMHLFEYALRDFLNFERCAAPGAVVVFDDIFPNHPAQAQRRRRTRAWTGDVWRIGAALRRWRPDLFVAGIDASPAGLLLVAGLDPQNRRLGERYDALAHEASLDETPPPHVIARAGALDPDGPAFARLVERLAELRAEHAPPAAFARELSRVAS